MEKTVFDSRSEPVAYISDDPRKIIFLWDGRPVSYLYGHHVYGFTGRHLGWFLNGVVSDRDGNRIGFTTSTSPLPTAQEPPKAKRYAVAKIQPREEALPCQTLVSATRKRASMPFSPRDRLHSSNGALNVR